MMSYINTDFNTIIDTVYNLSLEDKVELKTLLTHNIADAKRDAIAANFKKAKAEENFGKLKFSSNISRLKKML
jgi:hypothetical protein